MHLPFALKRTRRIGARRGVKGQRLSTGKFPKTNPLISKDFTKRPDLDATLCGHKALAPPLPIRQFGPHPPRNAFSDRHA